MNVLLPLFQVHTTRETGQESCWWKKDWVPDQQWISNRDNNLWNILLKRRRYLKIYLRQHFFLHKFTVAKHKKSQTLMAARLDCQPIRRVENSSSGSMYKTNQSDFVTTFLLPASNFKIFSQNISRQMCPSCTPN